MLVINKFSSFSASISKNSDRLISCSSDNLGGIRPGSYVKIGSDNFLYTALSNKKFFYNKDFEVINSKTLKINSNTETNLQKEDNIKIIYDEYKLGFVLSIVHPGKFYKEGDIITVKGGELSIDISSGIGYPTKLKIEELNEFGGVTKLSCDFEGKYIEPPKGKIETYGGHGENLLLELEYLKIDNRSIQEKIIKYIDFKDNSTVLTLDYSLPLGVKTGSLSTEKWEILLNNAYKGETCFGVNCQIFNDFTPNLRLPLMVRNSQSPDLIFNQSLFLIDKELQNLRQEIDMLKKKVKN